MTGPELHQETIYVPCGFGPAGYQLDCFGDVSMHLNVLAHMTLGDWVSLSLFILFIIFAKSKVRR